MISCKVWAKSDVKCLRSKCYNEVYTCVVFLRNVFFRCVVPRSFFLNGVFVLLCNTLRIFQALFCDFITLALVLSSLL